MAQFLGFGNGSDGDVTLSGTYSPIDSSCSGTSGTTSLAATNASFAPGQRILIHQSRGTGVGQWEDNTIASYTTGTITTTNALSYSYTDSGASQAQVIVMPQYSSITVSGTLTAKSWNGDVGGIIPLLCNGKTDVSGTITANGTVANTKNGPGTASGSTGGGFRGGDAYGGGSLQSMSGEGSVGASVAQRTSNGNAGGGGVRTGGTVGQPGGGGSYGTSGASGASGNNGAGGAVGDIVGSADLTTIFFGGGGGGGCNDSVDSSEVISSGASGGGIILIFSSKITVSGTITAKGGNAATGGTELSIGGAGAGGSVLIKSKKPVLGSGLIIADGGDGVTNVYDQYTNFGGDGRIRIESCSVTGTTSPTASLSTGGHSYCGGSAFLL